MMKMFRIGSLALLLICFSQFPRISAFASPTDLPLPSSQSNRLTNDRLTDLSLRKDAQREQHRQEWINRSIAYHSKVMREEQRRNIGQIQKAELDSAACQEEFHQLAKKHYFALRKIKDSQHRHAELIYRRIIGEIMNEEEGHCDHAKLAVTTLLLALHCQRMEDLKKTRSVFLSFVRVVVVENDNDEKECACSAKVLGAYALFEMKQGNELKSLEIARKAVQFDRSLEPVLQWKHFRDVLQRRSSNDMAA
jgi:hypothetical protein